MQTEQEKNILLASVSRSFYLTIRVLPKSLRHPIRTAYLLARLTDTIADTIEIPVEMRRRHLALLRSALTGKIPASEILPVAMEAAPYQSKHAEKILLTQLLEIFEDYQSLSLEDHAHVQWVLEQIITGQEEDLETRRLANAAALERYTWLVAGCVGEFWTKICAEKLTPFASLCREEMLTLGGDYGKGLQLVNILRDFPEDLANGRIYLPDGDSYDQWLERAKTLLQRGWAYVMALHSWRLRFACALPVLIGRRTLYLLESLKQRPPTEKIKILRSEVRQILWQTAWRSPSRKQLEGFWRSFP